MVDLEKLAAVSEGAELPPTVREAVRAILDAPVLDTQLGVVGPVAHGVYALVPVRGER